ncbi:hypothetical protein ACFFKH_01970 [Micromonospora marina]|uniref:hypothetical protein n=1 Tax=Micromonospora marina TaxID=307120 RepID=UPI001FC929ED|nr:hypothetical protein [Micromonospora marina]
MARLAVALGALASRAVTRSAGYGVAVLITGAAGVGLLLTGWAVAWTAVALTGYAWERRTRS